MASNSAEIIARVRQAEIHRKESERRHAAFEEEMRRSSIWEKALMDAASNNGDFSLYNTNLGDIDPMLYKFKENMGVALTALRLVGMGLTVLPAELCSSLPSLTLLSLGGNHLMSLPENIVELTKLTDLLLPKNNLICLPDRIGLMCSLSRLELSCNKLESLPITFGGLQKLLKIECECNCLRLLPENLNHLLMCTTVNVNQNRLIRLPKSLGRMPSLTSLSCTKNEISYIPQELSECKTMKILRVGCNRIPYLPENIGNMHHLVELALDYNDFRTLPMTMYKLKKLKLFRVEGNPTLTDPPPDVLDKGAKGVIAYMTQKYADDEYWRMKRIVTYVQNLCKQIDERNIADPSLFQAGFMIEKDPWFAVDVDYLWKDIIPAMIKTWRSERTTKPGYINSFPFDAKEVNWAMTRFQDAYGSVFRRQVAWFTRCGCVDKDGRRKPCIPPAPGFMCARISTLYKGVIVLSKTRQERIWQDYMVGGVDDAVKRAKHEAESYLKSVDGSLWLSSLAFEKAEEALDENGAGDAMKWREELANKRKLGIVRKFDRKKRRVQRQRDKKAVVINEQLAQSKEHFDMAREGYMKKTISFQIDALTKQLAQLPENYELLRLQQQCERECAEVDEDLFGDASTTESSSSESSATNSEDDDEEVRERRQKRRANRRRDRKKLDEMRAELAEQQKIVQKRVDAIESIDEKLEKRREIERMGGVPPGSEIPLQLRKLRLKLIQGAHFFSIPRNIERELARSKTIRRYRKHMRFARDMIDIRIKQYTRTMNGEFAELQKELEHDLYHNYVSHHVAEARRKAEKEFNAIDTIRQNWQGLGAKLIFNEWKAYIKNRKIRARKDLRYALKKLFSNCCMFGGAIWITIVAYVCRFYWRIAVRTFEACMESVRIAEAQVNMWERCVNVYTDEPFYKHTITGEITLEKPDIKHYLPPKFVIPAPPPVLPPEVSMETSSEEEDLPKNKKDESDMPEEKKCKRQSVHDMMARRVQSEYNRKIKNVKRNEEREKKNKNNDNKRVSLLGKRSGDSVTTGTNSNTRSNSSSSSSESDSNASPPGSDDSQSEASDENDEESKESEDEKRDRLPPIKQLGISRQASMGSMASRITKKSADEVEQNKKADAEQKKRKLTKTQIQEAMTEQLRAHQKEMLTPLGKKYESEEERKQFFDEISSVGSASFDNTKGKSRSSKFGTGEFNLSRKGSALNKNGISSEARAAASANSGVFGSMLKHKKLIREGHFDSPLLATLNRSSSRIPFSNVPSSNALVINTDSSGNENQLVNGDILGDEYQEVEDEEEEGENWSYDDGEGYDEYEEDEEGDRQQSLIEEQNSLISKASTEPSTFSYGPDSLRVRKAPGRFRRALFQQEPVVEARSDLHDRLDLAKAYMNTEAYKNTTVKLPDVDRTDMNALIAVNRLTREEETERAERAVKRVSIALCGIIDFVLLLIL